MPRRPHPRAAVLVPFALALSLPLLSGSGGCGDAPKDACVDLDASVPPADAGSSCTYPCKLALAGDDAGGDTYANFASGFFETYCTRCHATERTQNCFLTGSATCRFGAPRGYDWDDPTAIRRHLRHIRGVMAGTSELTMPPDLPAIADPTKPEPPCDLRFRLVRWIDAGAPGL